MKVHIIDPGLIMRAGHHYNYNLAVSDELTKRGIQSQIYGFSGADADVMKDLSVSPVFRDYLYSNISKDTSESCRTLENYFHKNSIFQQDLSAAIRVTNLSTSDVLFFHTVNQNILLGIYQWLISIPKEQRPFTIICFQINVADDPELTIPALYRMTLKVFQRLMDRVMFCACSDELGAVYNRLGGIEVETVPYPVDPIALQGEENVNEAKNPEDVSRARRIRVAYLGHSVPRRGIGLIPGIVDTVLRKGHEIEFVIQLTHPEIPLIKSIAQDLSKHAGRVQIIYGELSAVDYIAHMSRADVILLPYSKEKYAYCHSGVFSDAMALGKVLVCPCSTWMARQMEKFNSGGICFSRAEVEPVSAAISRLVREWPESHSHAKEAAPKWRDCHNAEKLVDRVLEFAAH